MNKTTKTAYTFKVDFLKLWLEAEMQEVFDFVEIFSIDKKIMISGKIDDVLIRLQSDFSKSYEELSNSDLELLKFKVFVFKANLGNIMFRHTQTNLNNFSKVLKFGSVQDALKTFRDNRVILQSTESELIEYSLKYSEDPSEQNKKDLVWRTSERDLSKRRYEKSLEDVFNTLMENLKK
jgi:hypothetical protein